MAQLVITITILFIATSYVYGSNSNGISFTFEVPNRDKHCFFHQFDFAADYIFSYTVIRGGIRDISVEILYQDEHDPRGNAGERRVREPLYRESQKVKDMVPMTIEPGTYIFCFVNDFSRISHKVVSFSLHPKDPKHQRPEAWITNTKSENTMMENSCQNLAAAMTNMRNYQRDQTGRDAQGYDVAITLNAHVLQWSLLQLCIFLILGMGQIYVLTTFFTETTNSIESPNGNEQTLDIQRF